METTVSTHTTTRRSALGRGAALLFLSAALVVAPGCARQTAGEASDPAAAKALFDQALVASLEGDTLAAEDLMFELVQRHPDTPHGRAARARLSGSGSALMVGTMGVLAAVAIPAFMKYVRRSKTSEATMNVRRMFDGAVAFYMTDRYGPDGQLLPRRFPQTTPPSPDRKFCEDGDDGFNADPSVWKHPGWQELNFAVDGAHRYQYQFISVGTGTDAMFTARALGDLNCDGVLSTFERVGVVDDEGDPNGGAGLYVNMELE